MIFALFLHFVCWKYEATSICIALAKKPWRLRSNDAIYAIRNCSVWVVAGDQRFADGVALTPSSLLFGGCRFFIVCSAYTGRIHGVQQLVTGYILSYAVCDAPLESIFITCWGPLHEELRGFIPPYSSAWIWLPGYLFIYLLFMYTDYGAPHEES